MLDCVSVPTVELILTFRFSSTLTFELTALMLTSEVRFCCAVSLKLIEPVFVVVELLVIGVDKVDIEPAAVTRPFLVGTDP